MKGANPMSTIARGPSKADLHEWEVEDALRTLTRAKEIEKDARLMKAVRAMAAKKLAAMQAVTGVQAKKK
jgi:hypothetical protein